MSHMVANVAFGASKIAVPHPAPEGPITVHSRHSATYAER